MNKKYVGIVDISNKEYHAEKEHLSSTNLKTILKSPEEFYSSKILGHRKEVSKDTQNNYDEGSYAHSLLLEPHLIDEEYKFYSGWRKQGKEWEQFQKDNEGFVLLSKPQKVKVEKWVDSAKKNKLVLPFLTGGQPELTLFGELFGAKIKVRADYFNLNGKYIADIKTTSFPADKDNFKYTALETYKYHLSSALYLMMLEKHFNCKLDFYFVVLSKADAKSYVYKLSEESRRLGEDLVRKAIQEYLNRKATNDWQSASVTNITVQTEIEEI